jgi:hypothetical protein
MKTLLSSLFLLLIISTSQAQKVKPALNLVKGNTYYTNSTVSSAITQSYNGQDVTIAVDMTAKTAYKVTDVKDTVYNMEVSYVSISLKVVSPNGTVEMSSDNKDTKDVSSSFLVGMVNKPFSVTITKAGRVLEVKNIQNIINAIVAGLPQMDDTQKAQMNDQFMQSFGETAFKGNLEEVLAIYPSVKVAKNDVWVIKTSMQSVMTANLVSTYQLQDITDAYYQIHGDAKVTTAMTGSSAQINGMPVKYDLGGTITTDIKADRKTGWVIEEKLKQDISGNVDILDNPKAPGGMQVPMKVHSDVNTVDH